MVSFSALRATGEVPARSTSASVTVPVKRPRIRAIGHAPARDHHRSTFVHPVIIAEIRCCSRSYFCADFNFWPLFIIAECLHISFFLTGHVSYFKVSAIINLVCIRTSVVAVIMLESLNVISIPKLPCISVPVFDP